MNKIFVTSFVFLFLAAQTPIAGLESSTGTSSDAIIESPLEKYMRKQMQMHHDDIAPGAFGGRMHDWYFATPYSARGRFVFIRRVSRRVLRANMEYVDKSWLYPKIEL